MAHTKIITPGAQDFGDRVVQQVKFSSRGLRGGDLNSLIKRASVQFIDKIASMHFEPGEVPIHLLAVGATEYYGPNRNGDAFREEVCKEYHPTFKKYARWYRHHDNKDTSKGRGIIKASTYNPDMHRIELLVVLNGTKEAAARNKGLVADEELEKLAAGEDIPVSMACLVSHDICSGCGNKARTRAEYCGPEICKYGGCKTNLAKTFDDGHTLHVDNPDPSFFDISRVFRPADRIAYTLGMAKAAADYQILLKEAAEHYGEPRSSAALAEKLGITPPLWILADGPWTDPKLLKQLKVASELIELEKQLEQEKEQNPRDRAFGDEVQPHCNDIPDIRHGPQKLAQVMTALAEEDCMLPVKVFVALMSGKSSAKTAAAARCIAERLPGIYNRFTNDPKFEEELRRNPYFPSGAVPQPVRHWVLKHAAEWSLSRPQVIQRLQLSVLRRPDSRISRRPRIKTAAADNTEELAKQYALYQLGLLAYKIDDPDAPFMRELAIRANTLA